MTIGRNVPCPCGSGKKYKQCCARHAGISVGRDVDARLRKGTAFQGAGLLQQALAEYQAVLRQQPDHPEALNLLASVAMAGGRSDMAIKALEHAIRIEPENAVLHNNLGNALKASGRPDLAETCYRQAIDLAPGYAIAHANLSSCLKDRKRADESLASLRRAIELAPSDARWWSDAGDLLIDMGKTDEARTFLEKALELQPDYAETHFRLACCLFCMGDLAGAWNEYSRRFQKEERPIPSRPFSQPGWTGQPLAGKTLLLWGEQGVGDEILFAGMLPHIIGTGARILLECDTRLVSLFSRSWPQVEVFARSTPPHPSLLGDDVNYHAPLGELGPRFRPTIERFSGLGPYLKPLPDQVTSWVDWLNLRGTGLKLGISWRSMLRDGVRNAYYTNLKQWGEVLKVKDVTFVNLQYGDCEDELREAESLFGVTIHRAPGLNLKDDLDGAAALTRALDLVIAPNTSVFAMAGAVGTPTWLLNLDSDWTMLGTNRMPWFPSVEVFAKSWEEPWENVLSKVAARLSGMAEAA